MRSKKHLLYGCAKTKSRDSRAMVVWKRPVAEKWKINIDVLVKQGLGTGLGVVVSDDRGMRCKYCFLSVVSQIDEGRSYCG